MKLLPFHKGAAVRLTDPDLDAHFRIHKYNGFDDDWKRFWDEYKSRTLFVKDAIEHDDDWDGRLAIYLEPLPDYVDHDVPFYSDEIDGEVDQFPKELFEV